MLILKQGSRAAPRLRMAGNLMLIDPEVGCQTQRQRVNQGPPSTGGPSKPKFPKGWTIQGATGTIEVGWVEFLESRRWIEI